MPLRVELDLSSAPPAELLPLLALLQRWCGPGQPPPFLQVTRAQLRELAAAAGPLAVFVERGEVGPWKHQALLGPVSAPAATTARAIPPAATRPLSSPRHRTDAPTVATPLLVDGSANFLALTLPSREHPRYADALALVREHGFVLEPSNRKWWLRDRHKALNFLAAQLTRLRTTFDAEFTENFERNTAQLRTAEVAAEIAPAGSDFSVTLGLRAGSADENAMRAAVAANRGYIAELHRKEK